MYFNKKTGSPKSFPLVHVFLEQQVLVTVAQLIQTVVGMNWGPRSVQRDRDLLLEVRHLVFGHSNLSGKENFVLENQQVGEARRV